MPKLNYTFIVNVDWLQVYCRQRDVFVSVDSGPIRTQIKEEYLTALYSCKMDIAFMENGKKIPYAELLFKPRVSTIPQNSCHLRILNEQLYTNTWFQKYCMLLASLPIEFRSITRLDICCDFNKFYGGLSPKLMIKKYLDGDFLKIGINRGYMSFADMGYTIPNGATKLPNGFTKKTPNINAITWGSKGYVQTQLYNKSRELRDVKFKPWIYEAWQRAGIDKEDVWRLEFRIQGAGKECQLLDTGDLFQLGVSDIMDVSRYYEVFYQYYLRYFRFVKADYHRKKQQMTPIKFFHELADLQPSIKLKIHPTKCHSNRTSTSVCNFLNSTARLADLGMIDNGDHSFSYHLKMASRGIEHVFNHLRPSKEEGTGFNEIKRLENEKCKELGGLWLAGLSMRQFP